METITVVAKSVVAPSTTNILPEPFRSTWIRALRFGYMPQAVATLASGRKARHCCLGVGATIADQLAYHDVYAIAIDCPTMWYGPNDELRRVCSSAMYVDAKALDSLKHKDEPWIDPNCNIALVLSSLNDGGTSHTDIANLIEKHL
jgi:hypothetical protein